MKDLNTYLNEVRLSDLKRSVSAKEHNYHPKDRDELKELVDRLIRERGNKADLNDIDTSSIDDMSYLFYKTNFNGDISQWDTSNVTNMNCMFFYSKFKGDNGYISDWDVSHVTDMTMMFMGSNFDGNLERWNADSVTYPDGLQDMFRESPLAQVRTRPKWYNEKVNDDLRRRGMIK